MSLWGNSSHFNYNTFYYLSLFPIKEELYNSAEIIAFEELHTIRTGKFLKSEGTQ